MTRLDAARAELADPLAGLAVLQLGNRLAGRLLARLLTDQGATVTAVDADDAASASSLSYDVVIDAAAEGLAARAGLGFDDLRRHHPHLVYVSLPVFPPGGPAPSPEVPDDVLIAAEMGLNFVAGQPPRDEELSVGSAFGAFLAAVYVAAVLYARPDGTPAEHITIPLAAAAFITVARRVIRADDTTLVDPVSGPRLPIASRYECADGRFVQSGGAYPRFVETLIDVVNRPEWRESAVEALAGLPTAEAEEEWRERLASVFRERTADEWERVVNDAGGSCTKCRTREEWLTHPHPLESGIVVVDKGRPRAGRGIRIFEADGPGRTESTGPRGEHTMPLAGIVVLDLSIVLAGPTCGRVLSDLGADVIKLDDPRRPISPYGWLEVNRGKRSMLLDLRRDEAREVLWRLVAQADVFVENYRHGKLAGLGFDFGSVARARPGIVYASLNAFDVGGSWERRAGWEHNAQAATGMQLALPGWGPGRPPDQVTYPLNDFGTGVLGAYGIILALRQRDRTGRAQFVAGSLARTATFIQSPLFEDRGDEAPASAVRWLACVDGYVGVVATRAATGDGSIDADDLARLSREDAAALLRGRGVPCVVVRSSGELAGRSWIRDGDLMADWVHPRWGRLHQARPHGWSSTFESAPSRPASDPGAETAALLAEHGYDDTEIEKLFANGTVASVPLFEMWSLA